jgi:rhodanese-related sulfurtransferase
MITLDRVSRLHSIILVSESGYESALGMMALQTIGYQSVRSLHGGMEAWSPYWGPVQAP